MLGGSLLIALVACGPICGIGGKFSLSNARVDPSFTCPNPSDHRPYDVHGTMDASNTTGSTVTIKSMSEANVTFAIHGNWSGPLGEKGGETIDNFTPKSFGPTSSGTIKFTIPFECTDTGPNIPTYGDFSFKFVVVTSAGTFNVDGANTHRLVISG